MVAIFAPASAGVVHALPGADRLAGLTARVDVVVRQVGARAGGGVDAFDRRAGFAVQIESAVGPTVAEVEMFQRLGQQNSVPAVRDALYSHGL